MALRKALRAAHIGYHPCVNYLVLSVFALVNAGVALSGEFLRQAFTSSVTLGVMLGLIVGKAVGVTAFAWLPARLGWVVLPGGVAWRHIIGAGLIGGVGFTVALFITGLAFTEKVLVERAKIGVVSAGLDPVSWTSHERAATDPGPSCRTRGSGACPPCWPCGWRG